MDRGVVAPRGAGLAESMACGGITDSAAETSCGGTGLVGAAASLDGME
jgi:hypothetical protein